MGNNRRKLCFRLGFLYFADIDANFSVRCHENKHHQGEIIVKDSRVFFCQIKPAVWSEVRQAPVATATRTPSKFNEQNKSYTRAS